MSELNLSNRIFPLCAVIRIDNVFPKNIRVSDRKHEPDTQFMMLVKSGEKMHLFLNLKTDLSEGEANKFIDFWTNGRSGRIVSIRKNIVEMEAPDQILELAKRMDQIPLARVAPNILRNRSDVYISIEFCRRSSIEVSGVVFKMLAADPLNNTTLEYFGENLMDAPYLLHPREDMDLPLSNFTSVTTLWEPGNENLSTVYNGFFLNDGNYVPKRLSSNSNDVLIIKTDGNEILGDMEVHCKDSESGLAEVELKSGYLSDLFNEIIKSYSGPLFYGGENRNGKSVRYYVLDTDLTPVFLKALSRFWQMPGRKEFKNYIYRIQNLEDLMKGA